MTARATRSVEIRPRRHSDIDQLARLLIQVHESDGYPVEGVDDPRAWLVSSHQIGAWVAELDGAVVGHVLLARPTPEDDAATLWMAQTGTTAESVAVLGRLFVHPAARGHRLGQRLTQTATAHAEARGQRAVLDVMAKDAAAIHIYESLGWRRLGPITHHVEPNRVEPAFAYVAPES